MKNKKTITKIILVAVMLLALCAIMLGCDDGDKVSAYDIAVSNGFVGTEQEWLDSLHGSNGVDGKDGADGQNYSSIEDIYAAAKSNGFEGSFLEFLDEYLTVSINSDNTYAVSKAIRSAVNVVSTFTKDEIVGGFYFGGGMSKKEVEYQAGGAGVIYKMDNNGNAYIITNFHVIYDYDSKQTNHVSEDIGLYLYGGEYEDQKISATFVGGSAYYDIAVLRVSGSEILKNSSATAVTVAEGSITVGQTAMAIGYPEMEGMSVTSGIVSVDSEQISVQVDGKYTYALRCIRIDSAVNSGNSGGGLFDSDGNLIGIVNAKNASTSTENIGYAIPKEIAIGVADNIIANCADSSKFSVYKCLIGVTTKTVDSKAIYDEATGKTLIRETIAVDSVTAGAKADGILQEGDVLLSATIGDKTVEVNRSFSLTDFLLTARVGDSVTINFLRDGQEQNATITFEEADITEYFVYGE